MWTVAQWALSPYSKKGPGSIPGRSTRVLSVCVCVCARMFSPCLCGFLPQSKDTLNHPCVCVCVYVYVWMCMCVPVCPAMDWRLIQGVSCLSPNDHWDRLQLPLATQKDKRFRKCV